MSANETTPTTVIPENTAALLDQWRIEVEARGNAHGTRAKHFEGRARWLSKDAYATIAF